MTTFKHVQPARHLAQVSALLLLAACGSDGDSGSTPLPDPGGGGGGGGGCAINPNASFDPLWAILALFGFGYLVFKLRAKAK